MLFGYCQRCLFWSCSGLVLVLFKSCLTSIVFFLNCRDETFVEKREELAKLIQRKVWKALPLLSQDD